MKCKVYDCENESWQGTFDGNLCMPCHDYCEDFIAQKKQYSQVYRNELQSCKDYLKYSEIYKIEELYK